MLTLDYVTMQFFMFKNEKKMNTIKYYRLCEDDLSKVPSMVCLVFLSVWAFN